MGHYLRNKLLLLHPEARWFTQHSLAPLLHNPTFLAHSMRNTSTKSCIE